MYQSIQTNNFIELSAEQLNINLRQEHKDYIEQAALKKEDIQDKKDIYEPYKQLAKDLKRHAISIEGVTFEDIDQSSLTDLQRAQLVHQALSPDEKYKDHLEDITNSYDQAVIAGGIPGQLMGKMKDSATEEAYPKTAGCMPGAKEKSEAILCIEEDKVVINGIFYPQLGDEKGKTYDFFQGSQIAIKMILNNGKWMLANLKAEDPFLILAVLKNELSQEEVEFLKIREIVMSDLDLQDNLKKDRVRVAELIRNISSAMRNGINQKLAENALISDLSINNVESAKNNFATLKAQVTEILEKHKNLIAHQDLAKEKVTVSKDACTKSIKMLRGKAQKLEEAIPKSHVILQGFGLMSSEISNKLKNLLDKEIDLNHRDLKKKIDLTNHPAAIYLEKFKAVIDQTTFIDFTCLEEDEKGKIMLATIEKFTAENIKMTQDLGDSDPTEENKNILNSALAKLDTFERDCAEYAYHETSKQLYDFQNQSQNKNISNSLWTVWKEVETLKKSPFGENIKNLNYLTDILKDTLDLMNNKTMENIEKYTNKSKIVEGRSSVCKKVAGAMLTVAGILLIAASVSVLFLTFGTSSVFSVLGTVAGAGLIAGGTASISGGAYVFLGGKEKGLSKSMDNLATMMKSDLK